MRIGYRTEYMSTLLLQQYVTYLKLALIWELLFAQPLYLQLSVRSRKSYILMRESFEVTKI